MASLKQPGVWGGHALGLRWCRHWYSPAFEGAQSHCFLLNMATLPAWPICSGWEGPMPSGHPLRKSWS